MRAERFRQQYGCEAWASSYRSNQQHHIFLHIGRRSRLGLILSSCAQGGRRAWTHAHAACACAARARMREARTPRRVSPHAVRCCAIQQMRTAMIQHSASGNETKSGEVSDPACSMPAAAGIDPRARMLVARTLSRDASLTLRCSLLCHIQLSSGSSTSGAGSEEVGDPLQRTVWQGTCTYHCTW